MKIGFIDKYLDEWHANHLPEWLREATDVEAIYAYEQMANPAEGGISGSEWAKEHDAILCGSIEEVIEKSDFLIVLAPNYPESHEELCDLPLRSGKPTYVDKTFAPNKEMARKLIELAKAHNTPLFTTSAVRYSDELIDVDTENIKTISMRGPGPLEMYSIHYIESIVRLFGPEAESVMFIGDKENPAYVMRFSGNRFATAHQFDWDCPFNISLKYSDEKAPLYIEKCNNFFIGFVKKLVEFFETAKNPVDYEETYAVIALRTAIIKAADTPGEWVNI